MKIILIFLSVMFISHAVNAMCNVCSATSEAACVDVDKFQLCVDGVAQSEVMPCPAGRYCTADRQICMGNDTNTASCGLCNQCLPDKAFACTSYNTFALCLASGEKSENYTCPAGLGCNIDSPNICIDVAITGVS